MRMSQALHLPLRPRLARHDQLPGSGRALRARRGQRISPIWHRRSIMDGNPLPNQRFSHSTGVPMHDLHAPPPLPE